MQIMIPEFLGVLPSGRPDIPGRLGPIVGTSGRPIYHYKKFKKVKKRIYNIKIFQNSKKIIKY